MPRTLDQDHPIVGAQARTAVAAKPVHRVASVSVPIAEWFDLLEALQGRRVRHGMFNHERLGTGVVAIADFAPFDRIIEFVLGVELRRRRILIDLPSRVEIAPLRHGVDRLTVRGWGSRLALDLPDGVYRSERRGTGAGPSPVSAVA